MNSFDIVHRSMYGGSDLWGSREDASFKLQNPGDGLIEVVGIYGSVLPPCPFSQAYSLYVQVVPHCKDEGAHVAVRQAHRPRTYH